MKEKEKISNTSQTNNPKTARGWAIPVFSLSFYAGSLLFLSMLPVTVIPAPGSEVESGLIIAISILAPVLLLLVNTVPSYVSLPLAVRLLTNLTLSGLLTACGYLLRAPLAVARYFQYNGPFADGALHDTLVSTANWSLRMELSIDERREACMALVEHLSHLGGEEMGTNELRAALCEQVEGMVGVFVEHGGASATAHAYEMCFRTIEEHMWSAESWTQIVDSTAIIPAVTRAYITMPQPSLLWLLGTFIALDFTNFCYKDSISSIFWARNAVGAALVNSFKDWMYNTDALQEYKKQVAKEYVSREKRIEDLTSEMRRLANMLANSRTELAKAELEKQTLSEALNKQADRLAHYEGARRGEGKQ